MEVLLDLPLYELFLASFIPTGKVLFVASIGAALGYYGIIGLTTHKQIAQFVLKVLLPSLMASKIGSSIKMENLLTLWIMPVFAFLHIIVGLIFALLFTFIVLLWKIVAGDRKDIYDFTVAAPYLVVSCAYGNCGYLPLSMIDTIVSSFPWLREVDGMVAYGEILISIYLIVFSPSFWLIAVQFVRVFFFRYLKTHEKYDSSDFKDSDDGDEINLVDENGMEAVEESEEGKDIENFEVDRDIHTIEMEEGSLEEGDSVLEKNEGGDVDNILLHIVNFYKRRKTLVLKVARDKRVRVIKDLISHVITPPFVGVCIGLTIGLVKPLNSMFFSENSPLRFIMDGLGMLGQASLPLSLIILGFSIYYHNPFRKMKSEEIMIPRASQVLMILYVLLRLVIISSANSLITLYMVEYDILPKDNMLRLVLLLEGVVPPALGLQIMAEVTTCEREVSIILFWNYIISVITMMWWLGFFAYILFIR